MNESKHGWRASQHGPVGPMVLGNVCGSVGMVLVVLVVKDFLVGRDVTATYGIARFCMLALSGFGLVVFAGMNGFRLVGLIAINTERISLRLRSIVRVTRASALALGAVLLVLGLAFGAARGSPTERDGRHYLVSDGGERELPTTRAIAQSVMLWRALLGASLGLLSGALGLSLALPLSWTDDVKQKDDGCSVDVPGVREDGR